MKHPKHGAQTILRREAAEWWRATRKRGPGRTSLTEARAALATLTNVAKAFADPTERQVRKLFLAVCKGL